MSQTESAANTSDEMSQSQEEPAASSSSTKPVRNPLEKFLVWGVIAIGIIVVVIEARATFGYHMTLSAITTKIKAVDESREPDAALSMNEAIELASFGPAVSEIESVAPVKLGDSHVWHRKLSWFSLAKTYELTLVLDGDQDDGMQTVLTIQTPNPPEDLLSEPPNPSDGEGGAPEEMDFEGMGGPGGGEVAGGGSDGEQGGPGEGGGRRGRGRARGLMGLMSVEAVAAELSLNEEQETRIAALSDTLREDSAGVGMREIFGQLREADESEQERLREQLSSMRADLEAKTREALQDILDEDQMTRLQQIAWQQSRESPLLTAQVAELLGLAEDQQAELNSLSEDLVDALQDVERGERGTIRESFREKFAAVLTDQQQSEWQSLLGEPFDMPAATGGGASGRPRRPQRPE